MGASKCRCRRRRAAHRKRTHGSAVGEGQIQLAVAVEVAARCRRAYSQGNHQDGEAEKLPLPLPVRSVTVAPRRRSRCWRRRDQLAVAVEIAKGQGDRIGSDGDSRWARKRPVPSPRIPTIPEVVLFAFATARSSRPSPLKSPTATAAGACRGLKEVAQRPALTVTQENHDDAESRMSPRGRTRPSPLKSLTAMPTGFMPLVVTTAGPKIRPCRCQEIPFVPDISFVTARCGDAVAVEITNRDSVGARAAGLKDGSRRDPPCRHQQDRHAAVRRIVRHRQVRDAIAVEINGRHVADRLRPVEKLAAAANRASA